MNQIDCFHIDMNDVHERLRLETIDVNLLVALAALLRERSVTEAAKRSGITQSAMSHTLRRLRELFRDPLLVRATGKMALSPRAETLATPLQAALDNLERALLEPAFFDPKTARNQFCLISPDLFDVLVLPQLVGHLRLAAPGVDLRLSGNYAQMSDRLATGESDLAIVPVLKEAGDFDMGIRPSADLRQKVLFRDSFRCFVRRGHPALTKNRRMPAKRFAALTHLMVSPSGEGRGVVDDALAKRQIERRVALRVPHFSTAIAITQNTDLVLTAPSALERCAGGELISMVPPIQLPEHAITLMWHPRFTADPGHRWLRETIASAAVQNK